MGEGKIAHRSSSSTVRGRNPARRRCFFPTRWGYGGRRRSCDGEEGGEGELNAPRKRNNERKARATLTVDETRDGGGRPDSDRIRTRRWHGFGQRRRRSRDGVRRGEARQFGQRRRRSRNGAALSGRRRVVPTAHLMHGRGAAHGSHVAMARCRAGPARRATSDGWGPLSVISELKIIPKENSSKQIARK
jgi:hypothetical protein